MTVQAFYLHKSMLSAHFGFSREEAAELCDAFPDGLISIGELWGPPETRRKRWEELWSVPEFEKYVDRLVGRGCLPAPVIVILADGQETEDGTDGLDTD